MTGRTSLKIVLLVAVLTAAVIPTVYAQGQGQGSQGQGQSSQGQASAGGGGNPATPGGNPPGGQGASSGGPGGRPSDAEFALEAVRNNRALPLAEILAIARPAVAGEVIDARLVTVRGFLVYEVKFLTREGQVSRSYYYARSGRKVGQD
jgi:uncharacterized membrane protein YkoI